MRRAEQVPAAEDLLKEAEEHFQRPAIRIQERDDVRRHIGQVGDDAQRAVAGGAGLADAAAFALAALLMRAALDADQPCRMIGGSSSFLLKPISTI